MKEECPKSALGKGPEAPKEMSQSNEKEMNQKEVKKTQGKIEKEQFGEWMVVERKHRRQQRQREPPVETANGNSC